MCQRYQLVNRRFPEITGEIIRESEAPVVGHHFRHGLLAYMYGSFSLKLDQRGCCFPDQIKIQLKHETF